MSRPVLVSVEIDAPPEEVWEEVSHLDRHAEWMADAGSIEFLTDQTSGAGTTMRVETKMGPLRTADIIHFTEWTPPLRMAVRHEGLVTGIGEFRLEPLDGGRTRFVWEERLDFPWHLGGELTAAAARPVMAAIWRRNLAKLAERF